MKAGGIAVLALALCGCAGLSEAECRSADWYALGFRDAIYELRPQDLVYGDSCSRYGAKIDAARYAQGWTDGRYEAEYRNPQPIH
jgi:hypothetical protein